MNHGKYVIFDDGTCLVFPLTTKHSDAAKAKISKPIAAGFYAEDVDFVHCTGDSITLNLLSRGVADVPFVKKALKITT